MIGLLYVWMQTTTYIKGATGTALTDNNGLAMKEVVLNATGKALGATYFRGSTPIDSIWATSNIGIANTCAMPAGYGVGDHRLFVVDLITSTLTGNNPPKIHRPAARRLNTKLPGVAERYIKIYKANARRHRLVECLGEAHKNSKNKAEIKHKVRKINLEAGQLMNN